MEAENSRKRRRYRAELKVQIVAECDRPELRWPRWRWRTGINANIVRGCRKLAREAGAGTVSDQFVAVVVAPVVPPVVDERAIEVELRRDGVTVKLSWSMSAAMDLSGWMRELLR